MGQQQLLLIVFGIIIVGISIAVGLQLYQTALVNANRDAVTDDLTTMGAKAFQYFQKPTMLGGGEFTFDGFSLTSLEVTNSNGEFRILSADDADNPTLPGAIPTAVSANTGVALGSNTTTIYLVGYGVEIGEDGTNLVQVYAIITGNSINNTVVN